MMRMLRAAVVLVILAGFFYGVTSLADKFQQSQDDAAYYRDVSEQLRETNRELRKQNTALRIQQEELVKYFEDQGEVVPGNLGGSGPPVSVIRRENSNSSDGGTERRIVRRSTSSVQPSQPSSAPSQPQQERSEPVVKIPDLPDVPVVPEVKIPDVTEMPKEVLKGTPLDGVL